METLYKWLGFGLFWLAVTVALTVFWLWAIPKIQSYDWWLWIQTYIFRRPRLFKDLDHIERMLYIIHRAKRLPTWKRNLLAYTIYRSRRKGLTI
ncbi:hypothetical protein MUN82_08620 [Hymenobacter aerilatus]|uniref:Uncharacterized protein n=1 Tax=Hymenobacter aerilatus TaxID=2932251 RepID=A0A8T9T4W9_9BACT|nr:hypothetical protein [Hymenobacter aerilatus]UOR07146.1 hypothetical protein MUN82_08620 [Hymenobacter aerilatus]